MRPLVDLALPEPEGSLFAQRLVASGLEARVLSEGAAISSRAAAIVIAADDPSAQALLRVGALRSTVRVVVLGTPDAALAARADRVVERERAEHDLIPVLRALLGVADPKPPSGEHALATISPTLEALLAAADRRLFPNDPPLAFTFLGGDEPAAALVPAELLESASSRDEAPFDEDAMDGALPSPTPPRPSAMPPQASSPPPRPSELPRRTSELPRRRSELPDASLGEEPPQPKTSPGTPTSISRRPPLRDERPRTSQPPRDGSTDQERAAPRGRSAPPSRSTSGEISAPPPRLVSDAAPPPIDGTGVHAARPRTAQVSAEWPHEDSVLGRTSPEGGRRGPLGEGGALRLLLRAVELRLDARVSIAADETVVLLLERGELVAMEGAIATRALDRLRHGGLALAPAYDDASARRSLDEAVERGALRELDRARALREAREAILAAIVGAPRASFTMMRLERDELPPRGPLPLGLPLRLALADAARSSLDRSRARAFLGAPVTLRRTARWEDAAARGLVPPELASVFALHDGASLEDVLDAAPDEPGLPGLICTLVAASALVASPTAASHSRQLANDERATLVRALLEDAAARAEEGDYFQLLGVEPTASDFDVARAYERRSRRLAALALDEVGLAALEPLRLRSLEALDEARRVLSNSRWREAYAAALGHTPAHPAHLATARAEH